MIFQGNIDLPRCAATSSSDCVGKKSEKDVNIRIFSISFYQWDIFSPQAQAEMKISEINKYFFMLIQRYVTFKKLYDFQVFDFLFNYFLKVYVFENFIFKSLKWVKLCLPSCILISLQKIQLVKCLNSVSSYQWLCTYKCTMLYSM